MWHHQCILAFISVWIVCRCFWSVVVYGYNFKKYNVFFIRHLLAHTEKWFIEKVLMITDYTSYLTKIKKLMYELWFKMSVTLYPRTKNTIQSHFMVPLIINGVHSPSFYESNQIDLQPIILIFDFQTINCLTLHCVQLSPPFINQQTSLKPLKVVLSKKA